MKTTTIALAAFGTFFTLQGCLFLWVLAIGPVILMDDVQAMDVVTASSALISFIMAWACAQVAMATN